MNTQIKPIRLECSDNRTYYGDTSIVIYEDYKISLLLSNNCGAVIGDKILFPKRGDMIIFRPDEVHFGRFPQSGEYQFLSFLIPTNLFDFIFQESKHLLSPFLDDSKDNSNLIQLPEPYKSKLITIAEELLAMIKNDTDTDAVLFAKLIEVLDLCSKYYPLQKAAPSVPTVSSLVTKAIQEIDEQFPFFAGLDDLASRCGCSVTYLTQTFRRYTGKSIHTYLTQRRLEHARHLLENGTSVTDTCYQSGFYDSSTFIALFKKHFKTTPGKYKKQETNDKIIQP